MKNLMMMALVLGGSILADSSVAKADHRWGGRGSSFSVSFGNGYNNFSYSQGRPRGFYGGPRGGFHSPPVIAVPVYRSYPVYSVPVHGGYGGYGGFSGYGGYPRHCH
jgi:hypothetical protein